MSGGRPPAVVLTGGDDILRSDRRTKLVAEYVGGADPTLVVTELDGDDYQMREVVDAAQTPPFLTEHRVVVARGAERFKAKEDHAQLVAYLADPLPTTVLVLEWGGAGRVPKAVADAVALAGGTTVSASAGRKLDDFVRTACTEAGLDVDRGAVGRIVDWLGDEPGRLSGLLALLVSSHGQDSTVGAADVQPFLGEGGGVPPWELTDAIDRGDIPAALVALSRMLGAGRHPLAIMATLHTHVERMLFLDGAGARNEQEAAAVLGLRGSSFPAKKAMHQVRRLGSGRVRQSVQLLARADLELRGSVDWPDSLVMEVLVARLARLARAG